MNENEHGVVVTPLSYSVGPLAGGHVGLRLPTAEIEALLPALGLYYRLSPAEARGLANALLRKADEAESGPSPTQ